MGDSGIVWLIIGAFVGWFFGLSEKGGPLGVVVNNMIGIVGALLGGLLAHIFDFHVGVGMVASIITATIGAIALLSIWRLFKRE
jgi:uncharacterized membrane protein YeaQ/YmgE (transglycosylase-associated protein family)